MPPLYPALFSNPLRCPCPGHFAEAEKLKTADRERKIYRRKAGTSPSLSVTHSAPDSVQFCLVGSRQNAQGEGNTEGSKKEQDKAVTSPPDTPARSADRVLRFLAVPEHFKSVLQNVP